MSRLGERAAVDDTKGLVARSLCRGGAGDALLARAALARDEHGRARGRDAATSSTTRAWRGSPESSRSAPLEPLELRAQAEVLGDERALLERLLGEREISAGRRASTMKS
jgi:hypothetical protein